MEEIQLHGVLSEAPKLFNINQPLADWDLSPVEGRGLYVRIHGDYGHVQIRMYKSLDFNNKLIWNLTKDQLPDEWGAKRGVQDAIRFFISYFEGIRGERIPLVFEINDGSYHPVDSKDRNYTTATIYAIVDCFAKNAIEFKEHRLIRKA